MRSWVVLGILYVAAFTWVLWRADTVVTDRSQLRAAQTEAALYKLQRDKYRSAYYMTIKRLLPKETADKFCTDMDALIDPDREVKQCQDTEDF